MHAFDIRQLLTEHAAKGALYHEFLRASDLSVGLYVLPAGGTDPQRPHTEDEIYYVAAGRGIINVAGEDRVVAAGSIVYVPARVEHRFHSIEEELRIIVFFAPAEHSRVALETAG